MSAPPVKEKYYGWNIVFAILVVLTFTSGLSFYNHSVYLNALAARPAFSVSSASLAVSLFFLSSGIAGLGVARWVQHHDPRYSITAGAVLSFLSLCLMSYVQEVWQLFVVYTLLGAGFAASALIPATTLVTRWFRRKRAMALSIASTGLSLGGVILTPLSVLMVDRLGFELAAPLIGTLYLIGIIPVAWIWLRPSPASMGLYIDGDPQPIRNVTEDGEHAAVDPVTEGISLAEARSGRFFWGVSLAYIFLMMAQVGGIAHQFGLAREQLSEAATAMAVAILPVASIVGRLIGGWIVERSSTRTFSICMMVLQALSLSLLSGGFNPVTLCVGLFLFGATVGNLLMLQPLIIAEAFGVRDYARIFSINNLMTSWGTAAGPAVLGYVYAVNQNFYSLPYAVAGLVAIIGLILFLAGGRMPR